MNENGTGNVSGNAQNVASAHVPRTYSSFDLMAHRFNTERFGEYTPIIAFESVKEDKLPVRLAHNLMSYTLKAPLMQDLTKIKELFAVPMECILPLNWEKFFDNPVRGDDVSSDVGPTVENFWKKIGQYMDVMLVTLRNHINATAPNASVLLQECLRFLILGEYFYSNGSLMATLGCHGAPYVDITVTFTDSEGVVHSNKISWDSYFDSFCSLVIKHINRFTLQDITNSSTYAVNSSNEYTRDSIPFRHALSLLRDDLTCWIDTVTYKTSSSDFITDLIDFFTLSASASNPQVTFVQANIPFNTQFLSAYQLCCSHYYSNDHIDFVYSAELFRQLIGNYISTNSFSKTFVRNGITYQYDYLSAHSFDGILSYYQYSNVIGNLLFVKNESSTASVGYRNMLGFWSALFAFRRSLKYMDYFTGARNAPLAVGSVDVSVTNNQVSVIDISRNIQKQRFLNSVNRIAHSFEGYLKGLFGGQLPAPDYHNPFSLARTKDSVFGDETTNTGDAQIDPSTGEGRNIAITTNLRANSNNYMFEIQSDRPCVIIAITHYDSPRVHVSTMDRSFLHVDRFDYFNPFMQYTGDQQVFLQELGTQSTLITSFQNFAYQLKYGEYKQLYNSCAGGFVEYLPGFIFPAIDRRGTNWRISPDYIRSVQSEFDSFYSSLTGFSLGSYFHFIVDNYVDFSGTRPMAYSPQILG